MSAGNISIYVTKADTARLEELGLEPKAWVRDTIKSALANLDHPDAAQFEAMVAQALTDEENQALEESEGPPSEVPVLEVSFKGTPLDTNGEEQDWVARLRNRAYPDGVPE